MSNEQKANLITVFVPTKEPIDIKKDVRVELTDRNIQFNPDNKDEDLLNLLPRKQKEYKCLLRNPGFEEYVTAMSVMLQPSGKRSILHAGKFIIESCWIEGDSQIKSNPKLLVSASIEAYDLLEYYDTELKKN